MSGGYLQGVLVLVVRDARDAIELMRRYRDNVLAVAVVLISPPGKDATNWANALVRHYGAEKGVDALVGVLAQAQAGVSRGGRGSSPRS